MAVSAAELPAMSSEMGTSIEIANALRKRLASGLQQIAYFVIPSAVAFVLLGDVVIASIYRTGQFRHDDVLFVWAVLAGSAVGLLASTSGRLYSSAFYALRDTHTPLKFAIIRVVLTLSVGYVCALPLPSLLGIASVGEHPGSRSRRVVRVARIRSPAPCSPLSDRHSNKRPCTPFALMGSCDWSGTRIRRSQNCASFPQCHPYWYLRAAVLRSDLCWSNAFDGHREPRSIYPLLARSTIDLVPRFRVFRADDCGCRNDLGVM